MSSITIQQKLEESIRPAHDWGPKSALLREEWRKIPRQMRTKEILKERLACLRRAIKPNSTIS